MNEFVKLADIADLTVGFVGTMAQYYTETGGVPFLRSLNIKPFKIVPDDLKYISALFSESISKSILHENDIVIVRTGLPGTCCVIPRQYDGCNCSDVVIVRPKESKVNPHYLAAFINIWGRQQILNNKVGAIQQHFNVHSAEEMLIYMPDIDTQNCIAKNILALNNKIECNEHICFSLEAMAKTLYDYWFVQFDFPDENGKPYRASGGKMVWNEQLKREIPKGWESKCITEVFDVCYGYPFDTNQFVEEDIGSPVIRIRDILEATVSARTIETVDEKYWVHSRDLIVGMDGNFHMNFWNGDPALLNQRCFKVSPKEDSVMIAYFSSMPYIKAREKNVTRTTVGHLGADDIKSLYVAYPIENNIRKYLTSVFDRILEKMCLAREENRELSKLRDWLLPMLINGQARVE